ncbi:putative PfkB family carbohydrate kinase [Talaromyces proteolyticus]|uniref:PfkB family carbohydrate kinase n=1 Tax=Talaromyces proteolyticus TaxID=1131652 RepID=A0AAD4KWG5_9EURO|nr:putative PfkB family carbohydrate kinase [Talaromyces proteolyticus]KAH8698418.1 putative PfkB family carbohydrate kinase [Talaromyces proteolyticus]
MGDGDSSARGEDEVDFCTLGMFIIDDIEFEGSRPPVYGIIGGAGSFAVVGARMVAGKEHGKAVSWILDVGSDFPEDMMNIIQSWGTGCIIREDKERLTTRAWNGYGANEKRDFKYLTPKLRLEPSMLSHSQLFSKTFHMVCSSERCVNIVQEILHKRKSLQEHAPSLSASNPIFVWEPVPDRCTPEDQEKFLAACQMVDLVSPNELELGMMFGRPGWNAADEEDRELVRKILQSGIGLDRQGCLVIRAGKDGSYSYSKGRKGLWLPAYYQPQLGESSKVIDPTGAGNSFLGALVQGMISEGRQSHTLLDTTLTTSSHWDEIKTTWGNDGQVPKAMICATVAAGFVVEQIGVPSVSKAANGRETWNGTEFIERLRIYTQRLCKTLEQSSQSHDWLID